MPEFTSKDRPVPPSEREQKIIEFLAERWKAWSTSNYVTGDPSLGRGYDMAKEGCADDVDEFMERMFDFEWLKAKVKES